VKLAIYNRGIPFNGTTPRTRPLGGSETSIVHMARELAGLGHDVTAYVNVELNDASPAEGSDSGERIFDGVLYRHYHRFFADYGSTPWDVVISFRSFDPFLLGRIAPRMIFWCGDACDQPALKNFEHPALQQSIDLILCVSNWHRTSFIEQFDLPPDKVVATRNGFSPEFVPPPQPRSWDRCAYSSTPFRGLEVLLRMFPRMRERTPSLTLDVFSSMKVYGWDEHVDRQTFGAIYDAAAQPGVTWHGSVAQPLLLNHLAQTGLFLYPNTFAETSCMAAIEAQACGAVVITTAKAALSETVDNGITGICLTGDPASSGYQHDFIATVATMLRNPSRLEEISSAARERAYRLYRWSSIASEWTELFREMAPVPVHARWSGPLTLLQKADAYLRKGNVTAAGHVLSTLDQTPFFKSEVDALRGKLAAWM
jgi:glycosyltransferase involved in cell wall biosynthesis